MDWAAIATMTSLHTLTLDGVTDMVALSTVTGLRELHVRDLHIDDISPLRALRLLRQLSLTDSLVADIAPLAELPELTYLDLTGLGWEIYVPYHTFRN